MNFLDTILNIIFPVNCVSCKKRDVDLCIDCLSDSPKVERECVEWIFPLFDYRHPPMKKSIWLLKYKNRKKLAKIFADVLYGKIIEELSELSQMKNFREPLLIPIPLSSKRYQERGYNQAELICDKLVEIDAKNIKNNPEKNFTLVKNVLIKTKETKHQANIKDRRERLKNLTDSFSVRNKDVIKNKNIILIDDVTTTGTTLEEACKTLKQSGAKKIIAFTVAH